MNKIVRQFSDGGPIDVHSMGVVPLIDRTDLDLAQAQIVMAHLSAHPNPRFVEAGQMWLSAIAAEQSRRANQRSLDVLTQSVDASLRNEEAAKVQTLAAQSQARSAQKVNFWLCIFACVSALGTIAQAVIACLKK